MRKHDCNFGDCAARNRLTTSWQVAYNVHVMYIKLLAVRFINNWVYKVCHSRLDPMQFT